VRPESYSEHFQTLRDAGVPQPVVEYLKHQKLSPWIYHGTEFLYIFVVVAGLFAGMRYLWPYLEGMTAQIAYARAKEIDGLLYDYNFGLSLIFGIFGWILAAGAPVLFAQAMSPRFLANFLVFGTPPNLKLRATRWLVRKILARAQSESDPARYVRRVELNWAWMFALSGALPIAIGAMMLVRDLRAHEIYTATTYVHLPLLPWKSSDPRLWSSAVKVETGCNHIEREGKISDDIIYEVRFPDGATTRLGDATPLQGSWLDAVEKIDSLLVASGVEFAPWRWLDRNPVHPLCIAALRERFPGTEFERVQRLLRLPG